MVVKPNTSNTVFHIKQEIMARDPEQTRQEFSLLSLGPLSKELKKCNIFEIQMKVGEKLDERKRLQDVQPITLYYSSLILMNIKIQFFRGGGKGSDLTPMEFPVHYLCNF